MLVSESVLKNILTMYGEEFSSLNQVMSGYRNHSHIVKTAPGQIRNVIVYKPEPGIAARVRRINEFCSFIAESGLPVRRPLNQRLVSITTGQRQTIAALYNFLPGETIPWESYRRSHIKLLGMAMARLHSAGSAFTGDLPNVIDEYLAIVARMRRYFVQDDVVAAMETKIQTKVTIRFLDEVTVFLEGCRSLSACVLHMDLVRSNVLFQKSFQSSEHFVIDDWTISGILDFEKAAIGHPLFDIARTLAFLMVDCPIAPDKQQDYFMNSGYIKRGRRTIHPIEMSGKDVLETLINLFLLYDFYKFLRHTPYESLHENHHFNRTLSILRTRKMVY